ncbi:MAG: nuclear transport factor 2 family protein [Acidobacteria bacterium]|nr:nuclear transport factor 2 family protein [Acidobacteriota bacterium]
MKYCPTCRRTYADDTLRFCLDDGALLLSESDSSSNPPSHRSNAATEILSSSSSAQTERMPPSIPTIAQSQPRPTERDLYAAASPPPQPKTQNTALVVGLTVIAMLILLALGGVGAWYFFRSDKTTTANTQSQSNQNRNENAQEKTPNANLKSYTTPNANLAPSPDRTPTPAPVDAAAVREQVTTVLNGWASASRAHDLDKHLSYYADTLDTYYNATNVSSSRVRTDRSRAYKIYTTLDVELSNLKITPDPSGDKATATFDKTWTFEGSEKYSSGSVHQKIWLTKIGGRWRITGEKDLQVYYVNNNRDEANSR